MIRGVARGGPRGPEPRSQNLADRLTLFEPGWADFAPHNTVSPVTQNGIWIEMSVSQRASRLRFHKIFE